MAYREVEIHLHKDFCCNNCRGLRRHCHCYRCGNALFSGDTGVRFRNTGGTLLTHKGVPKYFCIPCGKLLSDSSIRQPLELKKEELNPE